MINNNKILTVSYGTFSCTLEGFEDSFGTMKAIAEYFRDLAADDRYFGAEPPQPDVDMLARIAQKEVSRRVEAREHEGKIVLSALSDQPAAEPAPAASAPVAPVVAATATALMNNADTPDHAPVEDAPTTVAPEVEPALAADPAPAEGQSETAPVEEMSDATAEAASEAPSAVSADFVEDENDIVPGQPDAEVEAFFANSTTADTPQFEDVTEAPGAPAPGPQADSIAAKLQRIRAVVSRHEESEDEDDYSEDEHADDAALTDEDADSGFDATQPVELLEDTAEEPQEDSVTEVPVAQQDAPAPVVEATAEDDTAEVDALEDEVTQDEDAFDADTLSAVLNGAETLPDTAAITESAEDSAADTLIDQDEDAHASVPDDAADEDVAAILSRLDQAEAAEAEDALADTLMADLPDEADEDELLDNLFDGEAEAPVVAPEADRAPAFATSEAMRVDPKPEVDPVEDALAGAAEALAARKPRARVIKVKRADLNAAIQRGDLEEYDNDGPTRPAADLDNLAPAKFGTTSLSPEDEAELARELAALEADIALDQETEQAEAAAADKIAEDLSDTMTLSADMRTDIEAYTAAEDWTAEEEDDAPDLSDVLSDAEQETADHAPEAEPADAAPNVEEAQEASEDVSEDAAAATGARRTLPTLDSEQGGDMTRLMAEADQQMDEPESATRRDAFAHLRAAVAAKKADDALGVKSDTGGQDDAYRNDLADVVRPRRPGRSGARTARPGDTQSAPLKLVAEQRIDIEDAAPAGPVRPRRVAALDEAVHLEGESFADFASEVGATTLAEQLEAAAAYMSFVEGREQFSRPQLMTKVRKLNGDAAFSREDGLRHFGQLLRSGKIEKLKGGRFTVSEDIGFRPDDHRAAS